MAISHAGHNHPATPAARAACRKALAAGTTTTPVPLDYISQHIRATAAKHAIKARMDRAYAKAEGCTIDKLHCENCGRIDPGHDEGYTACCNELLSYSRTDCRNHHSR